MDIEHAQSLFEGFLQRFFEERQADYNYGEIFEPLYFDLCEFAGRKGKRIRPLLVLLVSRSLGGAGSFENLALVRSAAAIELLHSFILIHDDVIDRSDKRRGLPTFHKLVEERLGKLQGRERIGQNVAMVMGDIVFAMAIEALHGADMPADRRHAMVNAFLRYATDTGVGEIYDILLGVRDITRVSTADIERMYHLKTTRYTFEAPAVMGALLAGASAEKITALKQLMDPLGFAFQIQNDLQEFRHFVAGDTLLPTDLLEGKKTLLLREAYDHLNEVDQSFLQMCLNASAITESTILKIRDLVLKSGASERLEKRSMELVETAERILQQGVFTPQEADDLRQAIALIRQQVRLPA